MAKTHISELVLRDGHQSMIATRMRTDDMLPICSKLDSIGFWSLEAWGGATFDSCVRFLKEDPWERLKRLRKALPNSRIQMLLRGQNLLGYRHYSDDVVRAFVSKSADNGVDVFRIFDAMNDMRNLRVSIEAVKKAGKHAEGCISYTTSPVHDIPSFVLMAGELEALGCDTICIKDMAGLLTPYATFELVKALRAAVSIPIHLHSHATSGLSAHVRHSRRWKRARPCWIPATPPSAKAPATPRPRASLPRCKAHPTTPDSTWRHCRRSPPISPRCARNTGSSRARSPAWIRACWSITCRAA